MKKPADGFEQAKKDALEKYGRAKKEKKADKEIQKICGLINKQKNLYTTSSCSGRIILIDIPSENKKDSCFLAKWHSRKKVENYWEKLSSVEGKKVWLKQEPFILHVSAKNMQDALAILKAKNMAGIKRGGINSVTPQRTMIELEATPHLSLLVKEGKKTLVSKEYFEKIASEANKKMLQNEKRREKFFSALQRIFKKS